MAANATTAPEPCTESEFFLLLLLLHHCRGTSSAFFFGSLGKKKEAIA
jgi:hypothetical protein